MSEDLRNRIANALGDLFSMENIDLDKLISVLRATDSEIAALREENARLKRNVTDLERALDNEIEEGAKLKAEREVLGSGFVSKQDLEYYNTSTGDCDRFVEVVSADYIDTHPHFNAIPVSIIKREG